METMLRLSRHALLWIATPVFGRRDFFQHQQVDFALVEAEQRFYLRFRDRTALRESWGAPASPPIAPLAPAP